MCVAPNDPRMKTPEGRAALARLGVEPGDELGSTKSGLKKKGGDASQGARPAGDAAGSALTSSPTPAAKPAGDVAPDPALAKGDGTLLGSLAGEDAVSWEGKDRVKERVRKANEGPPALVDPTDLALREAAARARRRLSTTDGVRSTFITGPQGATPYRKGRF